MKPVYTGRQMREIDRYAIETVGIPGVVLMENAGRTASLIIAGEARDMALDPFDTSIVVVCGRGNNGGDGFVIARYLREMGFNVIVHLIGVKGGVKGDAAVMMNAYISSGGEVFEHGDSLDRSLINDLMGCHVAVDAIFGTGLEEEPEGMYLEAIQMFDSVEGMVISVDIPSGVDANTGRILGDAVYADVTVTFGYEKVGHVVEPGFSCCGTVIAVDIGLPEIAGGRVKPTHFLVTPELVYEANPVREPEFHKGEAGRVYVVGGSTGMTGAVVMACEGALVAGSGLIYAVVPGSLNQVFEVKLTEQLTIPVEDEGKGYFTATAAKDVLRYIKRAHAVGIGPGLSWRSETAEFIYSLVGGVEVPIVIDADGINVLSEKPEVLKDAMAPIIITPHEMEMARLLKKEVSYVRGNRIESALAFSQEYGVITLLKGYRTVIATPKGEVYINPTGNPYMATGGMGDVLTGIIISYLGRG